MLEADNVRPVFEKNNVAIVVADLSTNDQRIWKELIEDIGERGLPVNLVYPPQLDAQAIMLPKLLSVANVTKAIEDASSSPNSK